MRPSAAGQRRASPGPEPDVSVSRIFTASARTCELGTITAGGYLRLHRVIDVSVDVLRTDAAEDAVAGKQIADGRLEPGKSQGNAGLPGELVDLAHLRRAPRVDEVNFLGIKPVSG